jgi:hypothetical protein
VASRSAPESVLRRFQRLFRGRETSYGQWLAKDNVKTVHAPVTEVQWKAHMLGKTNPILGIVPITETNDCYFGAIDVDDDTVNHASLAAIVNHAALPLVVCRSKSGGAHIYLFLKDPAPAKMVVDKLKRWATALKLQNPPYPNGQPHPIEIFPKQTKIDATDPGKGNWINLPYYGNGTTERYAVTEEGDKLELAAFLDYAESRAITAIELEGLEPDIHEAFQEGPPCLNTLDTVGFPEGSRNMGLLAVGTYYKLRYGDDFVSYLKEYNASGKVQPPLKERELQGLINSLQKHDYAYKCDDIPIAPYCEKGRCKKLKWGIGGFRKKLVDQALPEMADLRKVTTDPPRWLLNVASDDIELQTEDLMLIPRFRRAVLERCSLIFPLLKQYEWDERLGELLANLTIIEAPSDAGVYGQFQVLLGEFLVRRRNARKREDLLNGLPYEEGNCVYFRGTDFIAFLERKRFKDSDASKVFTSLRALGAGHTKWNVKGTGLQLWFIPTPQDQDEEFDAVQSEDPEF